MLLTERFLSVKIQLTEVSNMKYKYELHCHTKEVSRCASIPAREIVKMYKEKGYDGIVITDHYSPMTFNLSNVWRPQTAIDFYTKGYKEALKYADDDFTVLLGMELRYYATVNDYLVYGITEDFLKNNGNLMSVYPKRFYKLAKENGLIVVQAHPFREWITRMNPEYLDGAEAFNGKSTKEMNENTVKWATSNQIKILTSGSDCHRQSSFAKGGIITDNPIKNNKDLIEILTNGEFERIETYNF